MAFLDKTGLALLWQRINSALNTAMASKVDIESGKGLSSNDYTDAEKNKLAGIEAGANKVETLAELTGDATHRTVTDTEKATWNAKSNFSGNYNDLTNKPTIPSIAGLATETYVNTKVAGLVDSAPATLDTLNELAAALGDDPNFATTVATQIGGKVDKVDGKGLSTNDYTTTEKNKLAGISESADAVSFTRSLTTGTKVGTITINGTGTDLYAPTNTDTTYSAGTGLALSGTTFNHSNSITAKNSWDGSKMGPLEFGGNLSVPELTYDSAGHITGHLYGNYTLPTIPVMTNDEIDAICGATIVSASEVSL